MMFEVDVDLPLKDAQHRPYRGRIKNIGGIVQVEAEMDLQ